ncbi:hypothetical protein GLOIN_2v1600628, partial [Rhizophagus irregularis DAOM 181602=DAOM 197198]
MIFGFFSALIIYININFFIFTFICIFSTNFREFICNFCLVIVFKIFLHKIKIFYSW